MTYYQNNHYPQSAPLETPFSRVSVPAKPGTVASQRMLFILAAVLLLIVPVLLAIRPQPGQPAETQLIPSAGLGVSSRAKSQGSDGKGAESAGAVVGLAPVFTPEVLHWAPQITAWADAFGLDPNLVAIIMQIESCGDPQALSGAGAQGLFQVMPFHFVAGENAFEPETNARRGLAYFVDRLAQTNGDVGRAFAGYNGGQLAASSSWSQWQPETQRYYVWSTGIYKDIGDGLTESPTLKEWLNAGGASLCRQAAARLDL